MSILKQIKGGATKFFGTLEEGWAKFFAKSGQALTRFTQRRSVGSEGSDLPDVVESWGMMAGEVAETDSHVVVRLEAPAMDKEDFEITVENGMLTVRGEKRFERDRREASYHVFEAAYGTFERVLPLPRQIDPEQAEAHYRRGVLTVRLPKTKDQKGRTIRVG